MNKVTLYGREAELTALAKGIADPNCGWIWILGQHCGVGKTALLSHCSRKANLSGGGRNQIVLHTEFSECDTETSSLYGALLELVDQLKLRHQRRHHAAEDQQQHHANEAPSFQPTSLELLQSWIPGLSACLSHDDDTTPSSSVAGGGAPATVVLPPAQKVQIAAKLLLGDLARVGFDLNIIWAVDNLHLASKEAMEVLVSLLPQVKVVATSVVEINTQLLNGFSSVRRIQLNNLSLADVGHFIQDRYQGKGKDYCTTLTERLWTLSLGNPLVLLNLLHGKFYLELSDNECLTPLDVWKQRISLLSDDAVATLQFASCFPSSRFDERLLVMVCNDSDDSMILGHLVSAEKAGLVVQPEDDYVWEFCHSQIKNLLYSALDKAAQQIHYKIGRRLWRHFEHNSAYQAHLDLILHQFLRGKSELQRGESTLIASLCLEAGKMSVTNKSYLDATRYFQSGIDLLGHDGWDTEYETCLLLHSMAAELYYFCSDFKNVEVMAEAVLTKAKSYRDTILVRQTQIYVLASRGRRDEAIDLGIEVLRQVGEPLPKKPSLIGALAALIKTKWLLRRRSDTSLLRLAPMTNPDKITAMVVCNLMILSSYLARPMLAPVLVSKMIQLTLKFGQCEMSSVAFSMYGMFLLMVVADVESGYRYGQMSLEMYKQNTNAAWLCRVYVGFYGCVRPYKDHITTCIGPLMDAYRVGLSTGDYEMALNAAFFCYANQFDSKYLPEQEAASRALMDQMITMGQTSNLNLLRLHFQTVLNFLGKSSDPKYLEGEILSAQAELNPGTKTHEPVFYLWIQFYSMFVAFYFRDYDLAVTFCHGLDELRKDKVATNAISEVGLIFYKAMSLLASGSRKFGYVHRGLKRIRHFAKHSPLNFKGKLHLLTAALAVAKDDHLLAASEFTSAIVFSREGGFILQEALAKEQCGRFYLKKGEPEKGIQYLLGATKLYEKWGGRAKVDQLQTELASLVPSEKISNQFSHEHDE